MCSDILKELMFRYHSDTLLLYHVESMKELMFRYHADTLSLYYVDSLKGLTPIPLLNTGIAWESDKKIKFNNPPGGLNNSAGQGTGAIWIMCINCGFFSKVSDRLYIYSNVYVFYY